MVTDQNFDLLMIIVGCRRGPRYTISSTTSIRLLYIINGFSDYSSVLIDNIFLYSYLKSGTHAFSFTYVPYPVY